jgi:glycosyltransferase involved in cell wall biosynthesis
VFVDDGSIDPTFSKVLAFSSSSIQVIKLPRNVEKSEALSLGLLAALNNGSDFVGFLDADGAFILRAITSIEVFSKELRLSQKLDMLWGLEWLKPDTISVGLIQDIILEELLPSSSCAGVKFQFSTLNVE